MMLKPMSWNDLSKEQKKELLRRPSQSQSQALKDKVVEIIENVQRLGDKALLTYTKQFDQIDLQSLRVSQFEFDEAMNQVSPVMAKAFEKIIKQLTLFHQEQMPKNYVVETSPGIICEQMVTPIQRIGMYVPAGTAPLVSTVFMLGVPSLLAGCPLRAMSAPPNPAGKVDPHLLVAAQYCGIKDFFKIGGAQAIAAMAYGTESVPKVDKIFGPGNSWVTMAKMLVSLDPKGARLDMPAGPSEVLVIADESADPAFVAADLLSQAEHGEDSQATLICMSKNFAERVNAMLVAQLKNLSRADIAVQALKESLCFVVQGDAQAIEISNEYAPEHLILQVKEPRKYLQDLHSAGSIFLGSWSPESVGDYASGTNHVLPTGGFAKSYSGLSVRDFVKTVTVQELTQEGLASIAETVRVLTQIEGLDAHQKAIDIRLENIKSGTI
ncbi:MAG TPA: histidinol dehydrogenase [Gammaproteobacteria bacterium]|nr:histidinol dehydrogenase [Gammaproteobacteria bacterium]